ncbi:MAG: flagellar hook assembly protein FlgD [Limnohabitans sp.]|nr:MAG: flagellar hook assembly protein FlgD [Limnohabitans sp.]
MLNSVNSATINNNTSPGTSGSASKTDAAASQDRFLKLFVAQLNNQDPMNPMDNAQMTSQMAQINTVSGLEKLNATVNNMAAQFNSMQVLQAAPMVGHGVLLESSTLSVNQGVAKGSIDLAGSADKVTVQIMTSGGQLVDTVQLGAKDAGRIDFEWNGSAYPGLTNPQFKVSATRGSQTIGATGLARDTITSVGTDSSGTLSVQLQGRNAVAYNSIKAFL